MYLKFSGFFSRLQLWTVQIICIISYFGPSELSGDGSLGLVCRCLPRHAVRLVFSGAQAPSQISPQIWTN